MKYKVGDKVRIKNTDIEGTIESIIRGQLIVNCKGSKIPTWPENIEIILNGKEVMLKLADIELPSGTTNIWDCPEGYQFVDENGNVIDAQKIVLKKKKKVYPKTYEECCIALEYIPHTDDIIGYKWDILQSLQKLLICRDAYWKIAGEEIGLGKPWEPDWKKQDKKYIISVFEDTVIYFENETYNRNTILSFPTAEMRDAFYENFKEEIEICKELL